METVNVNVAGNRPLADVLPLGTRTHLGYLDGLRAIAAIYVVMQHAMLEEYINRIPTHGFGKLVYTFFNQGHYAVSLFIMLSGFCLVLPVVKSGGVLRGGPYAFFIKRARRILPPFLCTLVLSLLLIHFFIGQQTGTLWDMSIPVSGVDIVKHLLLVHDLFRKDANKINVVLWSIATEWRIYFFFPLLVWLWSRFTPLSVSLRTLAVSAILAKAFGHFAGQTFYAQYIGLFAVGMLAAETAYGDDRLAKFRAVRWELLILPAFVLWVYMAEVRHAYSVWSDLVFSAFGFCLLVHAAKPLPNRLSSVLGARPLVFLGTFSYSIYLIHLPFLQLLWQYPFAVLQHRPVEMFIALIVVGIPIILVVSYVFHLCFERPFMNTKPQREVALVMAAHAS